MTNEKKRTLVEEWRILRRALGIIKREVPGFWRNQVLSILAVTFSPYFGLYMSARMLNELSGECDVKRLFMLAGITISGGFVISMLARILQGKTNLTSNPMWIVVRAMLGNAQNEFQFTHLENPEMVLLRSKIHAGIAATGGGLLRVGWIFSGLISNVVEIIFSVSLTLSMFVMTAKGEFSGILGFVNSEVSAVVIVALIVINTVCSSKFSAKKELKARTAIAGLEKSNVWFRATHRLRGADMIAFDLNRIVLDEYRKHEINAQWLIDSEKIAIHYGRLAVLQDAALNIVIFLYTAAKAYVGAFGIGNFILYQGTVQRFIKAISELASDVGGLLYNNNYLVDLYEFLDLPNDMYKGTLAVEKREDIDYEVEFRDVSFKYPRTDTWALRHVSMKFKIGEKLAIVGENGSGKTTFIKLLCRLYDPTEGKILLNGIDITRYRYDEYMALFSVVFQDFTLFGFPLGENVSAANTYDPTKVRDCLIRAGLGEKLADLEQEAAGSEKDALGMEQAASDVAQSAEAKEKKDPLMRGIGRDYDSEGIDFSGGEKQKIALARALYKDAPFVILDEPTAALDPIAEAEVYENFNKIVQNKTAVFISHRLSSCKFCHSIAVFDHGQLVQRGSHEELVADEQGKYSQLWHAQAQYYVTKGA